MAFNTTAFPRAGTAVQPPKAECCVPLTITGPATTNPTPKCYNDGVFPELSVTVVSGTPPYYYQWYISENSDGSGGTPVQDSTRSGFFPSSNLTPRTYYYYCVATNACGEETSAVSGAHIINARPDGIPVIASGADQTICDGVLITTAWLESLLETSSYNFVIYTDSGCTTIYADDVTANYTTGTHSFFVVFKNTTTGCESLPEDALALYITVIEKVTPLVSIAVTTGSNPTCAGTAVTFTATPTYGGTAPTYKWTVNDSEEQNGSSATFTWTPTNGDKVKCILTSNATCVTASTATSNEIEITVNPLPDFELGKEPVKGCEDGKGKITILSPLGSPGEYSYALNDETFTNDKTVFTDLPNGNYYVKVKDNATGCITTYSEILEIDCNPNCENLPLININHTGKEQ